MAPSTVPQPAVARPRKTLDRVRPRALKTVETREVEMLQDVMDALDDAQIKHSAAAAFMEISEAQLSRQLAGQEHLSARRLGLLPPEFHMALIVRRARRFDLHVQSRTRRREHFAKAQQVLLDIAEDRL